MNEYLSRRLHVCVERAAICSCSVRVLGCLSSPVHHLAKHLDFIWCLGVMDPDPSVLVGSSLIIQIQNQSRIMLESNLSFDIYRTKLNMVNLPWKLDKTSWTYGIERRKLRLMIIPGARMRSRLPPPSSAAGRSKRTRPTRSTKYIRFNIFWVNF